MWLSYECGVISLAREEGARLSEEAPVGRQGNAQSVPRTIPGRWRPSSRETGLPLSQTLGVCFRDPVGASDFACYESSPNPHMRGVPIASGPVLATTHQTNRKIFVLGVRDGVAGHGFRVRSALAAVSPGLSKVAYHHLVTPHPHLYCI